MSNTVMNHEHAAKVIYHFLEYGHLVGRGNAGGILLLYINAPLGAFSVSHDGARTVFRPGARYAEDGSMFIDQRDRPTYTIPHDYQGGWHEPFFVKYVPALVDAHSELGNLLDSFDKQQKQDPPDSAPGARLLLIGFIVASILAFIISMAVSK